MKHSLLSNPTGFTTAEIKTELAFENPNLSIHVAEGIPLDAAISTVRSINICLEQVNIAQINGHLHPVCAEYICIHLIGIQQATLKAVLAGIIEK